MKLPLLAALLLFNVLLHAQDTITHPKKTIEQRQKRFDIGGGVQVTRLGYMEIGAGPLFSIKANSRYGRIAGLLNIAYNFQKPYNYYEPWYWGPDGKYTSHVKYNYVKISLAMYIPLVNRSNKKGFGLSALLGLSYYNGLGSGKFKSFSDELSPSAKDTLDNIYQIDYIPTQKFNFKNYNMEGVGFDIGLSFSYTFKKYQIFADALFNRVGYIGNGNNGTIDKNYNNPAHAKNINLYDYSFNVGMRYCLYQPWQAKPPKRKFVEG